MSPLLADDAQATDGTNEPQHLREIPRDLNPGWLVLSQEGLDPLVLGLGGIYALKYVFVAVLQGIEAHHGDDICSTILDDTLRDSDDINETLVCTIGLWVGSIILRRQ